jgi:uncharacterized membrane protein
LVDIVGHGETPIRQLIQTALIKKADFEFSLLFALEKPPRGLAYFGLKHRSLMMDKSIRHGSFEMTAAMLISGTIGWFVLVSGQPVLDVVFWRCVFGAGTLLLICAAFGFLRPGILTRTTFLLAVLSGVAIVGNWVLLFASYSRASIAIGTAVYNVQPFMLVGLAALFLNEKITLQKLFWLGISFLGMLAIVSAHGGQGESGNDYLMGIALALGAAFLYAIAALIIKRLTGTPPHLIALVQVTTGVLLLGTAASAERLGESGHPGHCPHRRDVCAALRRDSKTADGTDRCAVLHLPDCGDFRGLVCLWPSSGAAAMDRCRRDSVGRCRHATGLEPEVSSDGDDAVSREETSDVPARCRLGQALAHLADVGG